MKVIVLNELKTEFGKVFLPDRKYYYHISTTYAKDSIIKNGLSTKFKGTRKKPNQGIPTNMRAVYLTNNPYKLIHPDNGSGSFFHQVDELVLFRVKKSFVHNLHKDEQYPLGGYRRDICILHISGYSSRRIGIYGRDSSSNK